jgi:molybdenum cofactor cytidylyltransferase
VNLFPPPAAPAPVGAVVLAAGGAARMGAVKQLFERHGEPWVRRAARMARSAVDGPVVVVVGAAARAVETAVGDLEVAVVENADWQAGMGGSLALASARALALEPRLAALLVLLVDQVRIELHYPASLVRRWREERPDVAVTRYSAAASVDDGPWGPPVVVAAHLFPRLLGAKGDAGARHWLKEPGLSRLVVLHPAAAFDADLPADLQDLEESS